MPSTSAPFGFRPIYSPMGTIRPQSIADGVLSGYTTAIKQFQVVKMVTGGVIEAQVAGDAFLGVFMGVEYQATVGSARTYSNQWTASASYVAGSCVVTVTSDPTIVYEVQSDATLTQAAIGDQANTSNATAGNATTGLSAATLGTLVGASSQGDWRVIDISPYPNNAWGDTYVVVRVQPARHQYVYPIVAV